MSNKKKIIKVPLSVVIQGHAAVYDEIKNCIPVNTFNKTNPKGAKWTADFRGCGAIDKHKVKCIRDAFNKKPWLTLLFDSTSEEDKEPEILRSVVDLLTPIKEDDDATHYKGFTNELPAFLQDEKNTLSPTISIEDKEPVMTKSDIERSFMVIKAEVAFLESAVTGNNNEQHNKNADALSTVATDAENLLFALKIECKHPPDEVAFAMRKLESSLERARDKAKHSSSGRPFDCDRSKIVSFPKSPSIFDTAEIDDSKDSTHGNKKDGNKVDETDQDNGLCDSETVDPDNSTLYVSANNNVEDTNEFDVTIDGQVIYDDNLVDDFVESQPLDI